MSPLAAVRLSFLEHEAWGAAMFREPKARLSVFEDSTEDVPTAQIFNKVAPRRAMLVSELCIKRPKRPCTAARCMYIPVTTLSMLRYGGTQ